MYGSSCIVAPNGSVLANAGRHEGVAMAVVDPVTPWRRPRCGGYEAQVVRDFLTEDRRPELYPPISQQPSDEATSATRRDRP
jgi:predicted amidohydrolase